MFKRVVRRAGIAIAALIVTAAATREDDYVCAWMKGCREETSRFHDIEGIELTTPEGWRYLNYPMAPNPPGQSNIRIVKGDVIVAITGFPNLDGRQITEEWLKGMLIQAAGLNVDLSLEKEIHHHPLSRDGIVGGYVSFTAKPGTYPFKVLPGPGYGAVTTLILSNQRTILSVSVVADSLPNADYDVAVEMIRNAST